MPEPKHEGVAGPAPESAGGLSEAEASRRLAEYGENAPAEHHVSVFERLADLCGGL
jgi:H+-transporting ATPase